MTYVNHWIVISLLLYSFSSAAQDSTQITQVLKQLHLDSSQCMTHLIDSKVMPTNSEEVMVVIPEIVEEGEHYFELNSHIVIVDKYSGTIKYSYFESSKTNEWYEDAIRLTDITIDTTTYMLSDETVAFGVIVSYVGSSHANPYERKTLSLFIKDQKKLTPILKNFTLKQFNGEWNTDCEGTFIELVNRLNVSDTSTNGLHDLIIHTTTTNSETFINREGECDERETEHKETVLLKYKDGVYK